MQHVVFILLLGAASPVGATGVGEVGIDWSGVSDEVVRRCRLMGLQNVILQALLESGYSVTQNPGPDGSRLYISYRSGAFILRAEQRGQERQRRIHAPPHCDSTIGIEIQYAARDLLDLLRQETRAVPAAEVALAPIPPPSRPRRTGAAFAGLAFMAPAPNAQFVGALGGYDHPLAHEASLRLFADVELHRTSKLGLAEAAVSAAAVYDLTSIVDIGLAFGLVGHLYDWHGQRGGHLDGRVGLPVTVDLGHLSLWVLPFLRMRPVTHRIDDREALRTRWLGVVVALTTTLGGGGNPEATRASVTRAE